MHKHKTAAGRQHTPSGGDDRSRAGADEILCGWPDPSITAIAQTVVAAISSAFTANGASTPTQAAGDLGVRMAL